MEQGYRESLEYLYSLQLFGIKLGLQNVRHLLQRLDNPQRRLRIIHVAGTNGKGSTAATLANIFAAAGIRAGLYTSPHLHSFTERIRIDTRQIAEAEVAALTAELRPHAEDLRATFFEFTTALALLHFQRQGAEWAILETGMGGRLDATNAVEPDLCLITPIALDHTGFLGKSLAAVATEKAGIIKPGVPVVSAGQPLEAEDVLRKTAREQQAPLFLADEDYCWAFIDGVLTFSGLGSSLGPLQPRLVGRHQQQNLALAWAGAQLLRRSGVPFSDEVLSRGIERTCWPGRLEWLPERVLLDGAHNPAGAQVLATYLAEQDLCHLHLVIGLKADKQYAEVLRPLLPFVAHVYATKPPVDDAVPPGKLVRLAKNSGILADDYDEPADALRAALAARAESETVVVAGSLFLVAAVREQLLSSAELLSIAD